jgi:hypothetical protein
MRALHHALLCGLIVLVALLGANAQEGLTMCGQRIAVAGSGGGGNSTSSNLPVLGQKVDLTFSVVPAAGNLSNPSIQITFPSETWTQNLTSTSISVSGCLAGSSNNVDIKSAEGIVVSGAISGSVKAGTFCQIKITGITIPTDDSFLIFEDENTFYGFKVAFLNVNTVAQESQDFENIFATVSVANVLSKVDVQLGGRSLAAGTLGLANGTQLSIRGTPLTATPYPQGAATNAALSLEVAFSQPMFDFTNGEYTASVTGCLTVSNTTSTSAAGLTLNQLTDTTGFLQIGSNVKFTTDECKIDLFTGNNTAPFQIPPSTFFFVDLTILEDTTNQNFRRVVYAGTSKTVATNDFQNFTSQTTPSNLALGAGVTSVKMSGTVKNSGSDQQFFAFLVDWDTPTVSGGNSSTGGNTTTLAQGFTISLSGCISANGTIDPTVSRTSENTVLLTSNQAFTLVQGQTCQITLNAANNSLKVLKDRASSPTIVVGFAPSASNPSTVQDIFDRATNWGIERRAVFTLTNASTTPSTTAAGAEVTSIRSQATSALGASNNATVEVFLPRFLAGQVFTVAVSGCVAQEVTTDWIAPSGLGFCYLLASVPVSGVDANKQCVVTVRGTANNGSAVQENNKLHNPLWVNATVNVPFYITINSNLAGLGNVSAFSYVVTAGGGGGGGGGSGNQTNQTTSAVPRIKNIRTTEKKRVTKRDLKSAESCMFAEAIPLRTHHAVEHYASTVNARVLARPHPALNRLQKKSTPSTYAAHAQRRF